MSVLFLRMMYPVSYLGNIAYIITKKRFLEQPKRHEPSLTHKVCKDLKL